MPLKRIANQKRQTLQEFYGEVAQSSIDFEIGKSCLTFIEWIDSQFPNTEIIARTSHYHLQLAPNENVHWLVDIACGYNHTYLIKYCLVADEGLKENAEILSEATSFEMAQEYLVTAMIKSGGWPNNDELKHLHKSQNLFTQ